MAYGTTLSGPGGGYGTTLEPSGEGGLRGAYGPVIQGPAGGWGLDLLPPARDRDDEEDTGETVEVFNPDLVASLYRAPARSPRPETRTGADRIRRDAWGKARPLDRREPAPYRYPPPLPRDFAGSWSTPAPRYAVQRLPWREVDARQNLVASPYRQASEADRRGVVPWGDDLQARDPRRALPYFYPPERDRSFTGPWPQEIDPVQAERALPYTHPPDKDGFRGPKWGPLPRRQEYPEPRLVYTPGDEIHVDLAEPYTYQPEPETFQPSGERDSYIVAPPASSTISPAPRPPGYEPPEFREDRIVAIYNSIVAKRIGSEDALPITRLKITTDQDSWCWAVRATVMDTEAAREVLPDAGGLEEIEATINGYMWRFVIEGYRREREHGRTVYQLDGRSRSAWLAKPHAPKRSRAVDEDRSVQQLANKELEFTDWTLEWKSADWTVPAGVWSYDGKTPIQAIIRIAQAAGGWVYTHRNQRKLTVARRYPVSPPDWPDAETVDVPVRLIRRASGEYHSDPRFSRVWVAGESEGGVLVECERPAWKTLEDDITADTVVDRLITHVQGGRARGRAVIDASGPKLRERLLMPLRPKSADEDGLLPPGKMIALQDDGESLTGLVQGVTIRAEAGDQGVSVTQSVEVEFREEEDDG